jgi:hypothetical protein
MEHSHRTQTLVCILRSCVTGRDRLHISDGTGSLPHHNVSLVRTKSQVLTTAIDRAAHTRLPPRANRGHREVQADIPISGVDVKLSGEAFR